MLQPLVSRIFSLNWQIHIDPPATSTGPTGPVALGKADPATGLQWPHLLVKIPDMAAHSRPMANGGRHWSLVKVQVSSNSKVQKSESHDSRFFFWRENPSAASKANKLISMLLYIMISFSTIGAIAIAMFRGGYTQSLKFKKGSSKTLQNLPRINITKVYQKELTSKEPRVQMHIPRYRHSALARVHGAAIWHNPWRISQLHPFLWISW